MYGLCCFGFNNYFGIVHKETIAIVFKYNFYKNN